MQKKTKKGKRIMHIVFASVIIVAGSIFIYANHLASNIKKVDVTLEELGVIKDADAEGGIGNDISYGKFRTGERFINIALFGVDTRSMDEYDGCRSDCIMVMTIDRESKTIKLASVARDTYAAIEGHGMDKITHAYAYGGPVLAVKTLNQNYNTNITDFVTVNFFGLSDIIDRLGGVEIDIDEDEIKYINGYIDEISKIKGISSEHITTTGLQNLSGVQAVAYSRIRYTSGGDFKRTERQREVLMKLGSRASTIKVADVMPIVSQLSSNLMTSLSVNDMYNIAAESIDGGYNKTIKQNMFPESDYASGQMIDGVYYYVGDVDKTKVRIQEFLFN